MLPVYLPSFSTPGQQISCRAQNDPSQWREWENAGPPDPIFNMMILSTVTVKALPFTANLRHSAAERTTSTTVASHRGRAYQKRPSAINPSLSLSIAIVISSTYVITSEGGLEFWSEAGISIDPPIDNIAAVVILKTVESSS
jgi:hypothetical protein